MQAKKLYFQMRPSASDPTLEEIGYGADGDVYSLKDSPDKVIKYSVHYCWDDCNQNTIIANKQEAMKLIQKNSHLFAKVFDFSFIGHGIRDTVNGRQDYLLFTCTMERLNKISEDERKVFHSIMSHEDSNKVKSYTQKQVESILHGLSYGLDFDRNKVIDFWIKVKNCKVNYTDMHPRNIMKDNLGNFKLIDFDRV